MSFPIGCSIVLGFGGQGQALEDAQGVRTEGEEWGRPGERQNLVGAGFPDHGELSEGSASLVKGEGEGRSG